MSFRDFLKKEKFLLKPFYRDRLVQKSHLGLVQDFKELFVASIQATPKKITINLLARLDLQSDVKPLDILKEHLSEETLQKAIIATSFPTLKTLARPLELQLTKAKEIDAIIQFQIEPLLPYPITEAVLDKLLIAQNSQGTQFLVFSVQKPDLQEYINELAISEINPEIIAPKAVGLLHFVDLFLGSYEPRLIIDIYATETTCMLIERGLPLAIRSLPLGLEPVGESQENHLQNYSRELSRIILSFQNLVDDIKSVPITFTGVSEQDPLILSLLGKLLGHRTEQPQKLPANVTLGEGITLEECTAYAAPIGMALLKSPFQKEKYLINFRKEEFAYTRKWRRWKKDLILYLSFTIALSLTFYCIGELALAPDQVALQEKYGEFVALHDKTPEEIEEAFIKQEGLKKANPLHKLSPSDLQKRFAFIESKFNDPQDEIALHANVPRVSDLLAWLTTHPTIKIADSPFKLETLNYTLVHRPEKSRPKERYQVKVDLDFTCTSPLAARSLQEALNTPNLFIDPREEIRWSVQKGKYNASFILKDRTEYP
ncbi:MAG: hypothetical protein JWO53_34 [Chlamydiia bacterium]|nr:hypothetical protein [Chlamydiia bacterium]